MAYGTVIDMSDIVDEGAWLADMDCREKEREQKAEAANRKRLERAGKHVYQRTMGGQPVTDSQRYAVELICKVMGDMTPNEKIHTKLAAYEFIRDHEQIYIEAKEKVKRGEIKMPRHSTIHMRESKAKTILSDAETLLTMGFSDWDRMDMFGEG